MYEIKIWRPLVLIAGICCANMLHAAQCHYTIRSEWNTGFTAAVTIENDTDETIDGWSVSWIFDDGATISQIWKAALQSSGPYIASNLSYNARILPGASADFGFNGRKATPNAPAQIPQLGGICAAGGANNQAPVAVATAAPERGTVPLTVSFDATGSSDPDGDSLSYLWDFGNGETSSAATPSKTYEQAGSFPVTLTVNDGALDSESVSLTIIADQPGNTVAYSLDAGRSSLHFVSTKNVHAVETHSFSGLSGSITSTGSATLRIDLDSVETGIDIRNQRMRNLLFETGTFAEASVALQVDMARLQDLAAGAVEKQDISAILNLHGIEAIVDTEVAVTRISADTLLVQNTAPLVINAGDYDLSNGVDALKDIANLTVISYAVPVNFTLFFTAL